MLNEWIGKDVLLVSHSTEVIVGLKDWDANGVYIEDEVGDTTLVMWHQVRMITRKLELMAEMSNDAS